VSRLTIPAQNYQTYTIKRPLGAEYWRDVDCGQAGCLRKRHGWRTVLDTSTRDGQATANWIRLKSGRSYTLAEDGPIVTFTFVAGQTCFERHRVALEREPLYVVSNVDGQGRRRQHTQGLFWVEDMEESLDKVRQDRKQG
jgi:hypothetical protein